MENTPKHIALSEWIRSKILDGTFPNESKLLSENELAEKFSISRQTVRQAIGTLVNEGMLVRKRGSGTYISYQRTYVPTSTKNIAVITTYLSEYIFPGVIKGIDKVLSEHGYHMNLGITYNRTSNENSVLTSMLKSGVDGLIIEPTKSALPNPNSNLYREMLQNHIPVVFINGYYSAFDFPYVTMDDYTSGKLNARHLINNGHDNLFGIFKSDDIQGHFRYSGFVNAIRENGLDFDDSNVVWYVTEDLEKLFSPENDRYLLSRIGKCTGIVCYNDEIAIKLLEMFKRNGRSVPAEYSVVSFDNSNLCDITDVALSSIAYPSEEIGMEAASKLIQIINGENPDLHTAIKPVLVERSSVRNTSTEWN